MRGIMKKILPGALASLVIGTVAWSQSAPPPGPPGGEMGPGMVFAYVGIQGGAHGKTVKGAPYSAQISTERSQTLSDGTHISQKMTGQVYRDSEGRTRRETSVAALGPLSATEAEHQIVSIHDAVAGVHYVLEPDLKVARKMTAKSGGQWMGEKEGRGPGRRGADRPQPQTESLGTQTMEGLTVEGTRTTFTIPAGQFGNDRPIQIVIERWYSPDLQTVIMSKHSDPRLGESVYHLTNISRTEPAASLFAVPADYTVKEGHAGGRGKMMRHGSAQPGLPPGEEDED